MKSPYKDLNFSKKPLSATSVSLAAKRLSSHAVSVSDTPNSPNTLSGKTSRLGLVSKKSSGSLSTHRTGSGVRAGGRQTFLPHGFRYHSNGDERASTAPSSTQNSKSCLSCASRKAEEVTTSFAKLSRMRAKIITSSSFLHSFARPKAKVKVCSSLPAIWEKRRQEELATPGLQHKTDQPQQCTDYNNE
ncbi:hypothetical protein PoB_004880600 [Plakobranchus ocellatus]|uniref:Uncharacterized protein n=1 Tax=Plakobranchus ocellatus TaxID=259542 RepID=A0AAV4BG31_9GAST|nr:hypothetical protein PoB_004880600 [Plakobranchus ocellatus]